MSRKQPDPYKPRNHLRILTATSLFDGHDASINIMRRILQASGAEVIHLGHNRSAGEIVRAAMQEDVQAIAVTSYQGGHMEYFSYMRDLLREQGADHIKIFGGGGGVILPEEIRELRKKKIARIYSPDEGRKLGLQGMINDLLRESDFPLGESFPFAPEEIYQRNPLALSRLITTTEVHPASVKELLSQIARRCQEKQTPVVGITGTGGAGKSSVVDELVRRFTEDRPDMTIGIISVDPSRRKTGGALLGDRIRMNAIDKPGIFMRSLATRQANLALSRHIREVMCIYRAAGFDLILLETSGIGQSDSEITDHSDVSLYVMTPEFGAATQLEKIDMLDFADLVVINKADKRGAADALRDVKKQYQRNHLLFDRDPDEMPVFNTMASRFNDPGMNQLYHALDARLSSHEGFSPGKRKKQSPPASVVYQILPPSRERYLAEIAETIRDYNARAEDAAEKANRLYGLHQALQAAGEHKAAADDELKQKLQELYRSAEKQTDPDHLRIIRNWEKKQKAYKREEYVYPVRGKEVRVKTHIETTSHLDIPKIALPRYTAWGDILRWNLLENVPGEFPYAGGVYPFRREWEDPTRMFAGEGGPERTNKRFHYLSRDLDFRRLSTAFDSVTLYGANPGQRPDIYGKVGNAGVSVATLDDAKRLYSGFNLSDPKTSVSMTINGPAPMLVGYFLNAAIDQQCEIYIRNQGLEKQVRKKIQSIYSKKGSSPPVYHGPLPEGNDGLGLLLLGVSGEEVLPAEVYRQIREETLSRVRGTVQADILKEDQAQNTCIFSTDFALKMMGDLQEYFIRNRVRNFYSVSISGYHIAEAGANPITQLAFTLANGFTYVEYYLARGMKINDFAPNLSFFFSNGVDPEYSVIGRVARIIWAKAMRYRYGAGERSQMLKYHIQTSGRSLHAQEIEFNDIRTSLQALSAIYDNCNSLHTNAYDEAITTPTEESVRRAMAIQLIINHEFGMTKNQNPLQGAFIIEELTRLVEEAVLMEFDRLTERGGVLGAMETMYQRNKIQSESLYYESLKHSGALPVIGVNTFLSAAGSPTVLPEEVIRSSEEEKQRQVERIAEYHRVHQAEAGLLLRELKKTVRENGNTFDAIIEATRHCSLEQITGALYEVGGQYRRNM